MQYEWEGNAAGSMPSHCRISAVRARVSALREWGANWRVQNDNRLHTNDRRGPQELGEKRTIGATWMRFVSALACRLLDGAGLCRWSETCVACYLPIYDDFSAPRNKKRKGKKLEWMGKLLYSHAREPVPENNGFATRAQGNAQSLIITQENNHSATRARSLTNTVTE